MRQGNETWLIFWKLHYNTEHQFLDQVFYYVRSVDCKVFQIGVKTHKGYLITEKNGIAYLARLKQTTTSTY